MQKYVVFGSKGSYHHQVVLQVFHPAEDDVLEFVDSFDAVLQKIVLGAKGVLAVHNTVVGPIADNARKLESTQGITVTGYSDLPIQHCLIGASMCDLSQITQVHSHPAALEQCAEWLATHVPQTELVACTDTAAAVSLVVVQQSMPWAAVGSEFAAQWYGAVVVARGCSDRADNSTRFAVLERGGLTPRLLPHLSICDS